MSLVKQNVMRIVQNGSRFYQFQGAAKIYPSVTSVLNILHKPGIAQWERRLERERLKKDLFAFESMPDQARFEQLMQNSIKHVSDIREYYTNFGHKAHELIEEIIRTGNHDITPSDPKLENVKESFLSWYRSALSRGLTFEATELPLISTKHGYGGTLDAVARISSQDHNLLVVIDWKTAAKIGNDYAIQLAAYAKLYEEVYQTKIDSGLIIRFDRSRAFFESKRVANLDESFEYFLHYLNIFKLQSKEHHIRLFE